MGTTAKLEVDGHSLELPVLEGHPGTVFLRHGQEAVPSVPEDEDDLADPRRDHGVGHAGEHRLPEDGMGNLVQGGLHPFPLSCGQNESGDPFHRSFLPRMVEWAGNKADYEFTGLDPERKR